MDKEGERDAFFSLRPKVENRAKTSAKVKGGKAVSHPSSTHASSTSSAQSPSDSVSVSVSSVTQEEREKEGERETKGGDASLQAELDAYLSNPVFMQMVLAGLK
ncbi:hypothetical protein KIPB_007716 [Kipferlia bialata]|uniref:Uncharacterized protein n=1 Tax=Kipferlia bialata TaxID=797122 RepID=A0A391NV58_9EUKA|nr:hypothetical protein KIPB_007716 [Kipferlia bialata]|eukprot:g7716.t1